MQAELAVVAHLEMQVELAVLAHLAVEVELQGQEQGQAALSAG